LQEEQLNVACIVYGSEKQKCTAASFRMGRPIGTLHIKDKIFALPGFSFVNNQENQTWKQFDY